MTCNYCNILLLANVFGIFRSIYLKIYELDTRKFLSSFGLTWKAALKRSKGNSNLLSDIDILLRVKKGIRGGICHFICRHAKVNNKYIKAYDKIKELSHIHFSM